ITLSRQVQKSPALLGEAGLFIARFFTQASSFSLSCRFYCCVFDQRLQRTISGHFSDDIAAADQFTGYPQLWECRPVGVLRQVGANFRVLQDIHVSEFLATLHDGLGRLRGETALRGIGRALHVKQNGVAGNLLFDRFDDIHGTPRLELCDSQVGTVAHCNAKSQRGARTHYAAATCTGTPFSAALPDNSSSCRSSVRSFALAPG